MKKCMNESSRFVDESLEGIYQAYPEFYSAGQEDLRALVHKSQKDKVQIITGGGYGHLPVFLGYVGDGLCDGAAVGNVFTSPSSETIMNVTRTVAGDKGVLYLFGNYFGDSMNFEMAKELAEMEGIAAEIVKISDDIASSERSDWKGRRGIAGIVFAYKLAGAAADAGYILEEVKRIAEEAAENTASFGVAFSSCTLPGAEGPIFEMDEEEMEIGMGIHGEPGIVRGTMKSSREIAEEICPALLEDLGLQAGDRISVLVNGLGTTSREELFILYRDAAEVLGKRGITVARTLVGEYATSLEMAGASISILKLNEEREQLLKRTAYTPFVSW